MAFSDLNRRTSEDDRDRTFRTKVAIQQFMNHNAPLFRALARGGVGIAAAVRGDVIREPAEQAGRLAMLVASKVTGKPIGEVTAADARPFRTEAAEWAAARWLDNRGYDLERAASEIAAAVRLADGGWDSDPWRDDRISDTASLMMTAAGVAGSLARQVEIYDFRAGREAALGRVVKEVVDSASKTAAEMLGPSAGPGDVRNLTQTLARNLSSLMEACYERKGRETVARLAGMTEAEKAAWYRANSPIDEVAATFREWAVCFSAYAVAATRDLEPDKQRERGPSA